jgi:hypothetical protein
MVRLAWLGHKAGGGEDVARGAAHHPLSVDPT